MKARIIKKTVKHIPKHIKPPCKSKRKLNWTRKCKLRELVDLGYDVSELRK